MHRSRRLRRGEGKPVRILSFCLVQKKARIASLPDSEESLKIYLAVLIEYRHVTNRQTDTQTDGHTSCDSVVRAIR